MELPTHRPMNAHGYPVQEVKRKFREVNPLAKGRPASALFWPTVLFCLKGREGALSNLWLPTSLSALDRLCPVVSLGLALRGQTPRVGQQRCMRQKLQEASRNFINLKSYCKVLSVRTKARWKAPQRRPGLPSIRGREGGKPRG